jgi:hypothetical protein
MPRSMCVLGYHTWLEIVLRNKYVYVIFEIYENYLKMVLTV